MMPTPFDDMLDDDEDVEPDTCGECGEDFEFCECQPPDEDEDEEDEE